MNIIGETHNRLGLEPRWYIGGYSFIITIPIKAIIIASEINRARATTTRITDYNVGSVARTLLEAPAQEIECIRYFPLDARLIYLRTMLVAMESLRTGVTSCAACWRRSLLVHGLSELVGSGGQLLTRHAGLSCPLPQTFRCRLGHLAVCLAVGDGLPVGCGRGVEFGTSASRIGG